MSSRPLASPASAIAGAMGGNNPLDSIMARDSGAPSLTRLSIAESTAFTAGAPALSRLIASERSSGKPAPRRTASSPTTLIIARRTAAEGRTGAPSAPAPLGAASIGIRPCWRRRSSASPRDTASTVPERRAPAAVTAR